ncbi:MAG: SpoIIE family protein phosphatase [Candidatus Riflebacteria bacterium]|nr:SpoIIE family protein phosphatase [Candidatus Riflebacteria bacterium]
MNGMNESPLCHLLAKLGTLIFGIITNFARTSDGKIKYFAFFGWQPLVLENRYLEKLLLKPQEQENEIAVWTGSKSLLSIPWLGANKEFHDFVRKPCHETPLTNSITLPGMGRYFVSKIPLSNLNFADVALISSDKRIREEIDGMQQHFYRSIGGVIAVSFILLLIIKRSFIKPLDDLKSGVRAIKERDFVFRIGKLGKDEFGELAQAFNGMLESFQDLEVARILQENIFPEKPLEQNSWEIAGMCKPTTAVGGDYFDYFEIDKRHIMFIIGDVTGHGIPAALVVAMAKAIIFHPSNSFKPEVILTNLSYVIISVLQKKKMMSCQIGLFDTMDRKLILSNAGHCFPLLIGKEYIREIEISGFLLGAKLKNKYETTEITLSEDEWMFFFTDGLAEAFDKSGNMLGYKKVREELPSQQNLSPCAILENLWKWHKSITIENSQEDDITLMVLKKNLRP